VKPDEFNGLIGNIAGNLIKDNAGQIIGGLFGGGSKGKLVTSEKTKNLFRKFHFIFINGYL